MSTLTRCNRCDVTAITEVYAKAGETVIVLPEPETLFPHAVSVYTTAGQLVAWYAALSESCVC